MSHPLAEKTDCCLLFPLYIRLSSCLGDIPGAGHDSLLIFHIYSPLPNSERRPWCAAPLPPPVSCSVFVSHLLILGISVIVTRVNALEASKKNLSFVSFIKLA